MSSDPNMPDFDSMSQEEMMAWMESLAKRQGADESGFTTDASVEIEEIDPSTVDDEILNQKYIPDGWTEEKWDAHLAKEEAEKQARLEKAKEKPKREPEPEPEPEPAVAQASAGADDGTPDFDSMSPEEMMAWMETLAKRQGADEGFTTSADANVAEIDPSTVDDAILNQKYVPDGWTEEKWDAYLEEEERKKQEKQAQAPAIPELELEYTDDSEEIEFIDEDDEELATLNLDDLPTIDINDEEETQAATENPMSWLENLAASDEDSQDIDIPDLSGIAEDMSGLEALAQEDTGDDPMDWLANLAGEVEDGTPDIDLSDMSEGLEGLEAFALAGDDEDEEDESVINVDDVEDPVNFLETLAGLEGAPDEELSTDANAAIPDLDSFMTEDDSDFELSDILEDTQPSEELDLDMAWGAEDPNSIENPEAWLDALAQSTSGDSGGQLSFLEDEEDFLEEEDEAVGDHDTRVMDALNSGEDLAPEDIEQFFVNQFKKAEEFADRDDDFSEPEEDEGEVEPAVEVGVPDWLQELSASSPAAQAEVEDDEEEGEDLMADVLASLEGEEEAAAEFVGMPDFITEDEDEAELVGIPDFISEDDEAEAVEIPDWLADHASEDEDEAEEVGIPDWLSQGAEGDTGDVMLDIMDDEEVDSGETAMIATETGQQIEVDPNDTWTQAFLMEDSEDEAEAWYSQRLTEIESDAPPAVTTDEPEPELTTAQISDPSGAVALEPATLPIEEELPEGQPESAPAWLVGDAVAEAVDAQPELELATEPAASGDIPSWLEDSISDDDEIEIPDWLTDEVGDDPIPDWLSEASSEEIEPAAIPDWLSETVEEPADIVAQVVEPEAPAQSIVAIPTPPPAADVSAAIQSAQQKVAADDLDGALQDYESVVRSNESVDVVVSDLQKLLNNDSHKKNPALYRVLGDALMRRGDLQDALDTYRRALNLL